MRESIKLKNREDLEDVEDVEVVEVDETSRFDDAILDDENEDVET